MAEDESNQGRVKVVGFWVSMYVHRVRWALTLKGVPYEYVEEDIFNKAPSLLKVNPIYGKVPVLVHEGIPLPESLIILEYIDETWPDGPALLPQDPYERAQARFWARFIDEKVLESMWHPMFRKGEKQEQAKITAMENLEKLEEILSQGGKSFFGGDTIGYLDLAAGTIANILPAWEEVAGVKILDPARFPALAAWKENFLNHPVVKAEYTPPWDETVAYYKSSVERRMSEYIAKFGE